MTIDSVLVASKRGTSDFSDIESRRAYLDRPFTLASKKAKEIIEENRDDVDSAIISLLTQAYLDSVNGDYESIDNDFYETISIVKSDLGRIDKEAKEELLDKVSLIYKASADAYLGGGQYSLDGKRRKKLIRELFFDHLPNEKVEKAETLSEIVEWSDLSSEASPKSIYDVSEKLKQFQDMEMLSEEDVKQLESSMRYHRKSMKAVFCHYSDKILEAISSPEGIEKEGVSYKGKRVWVEDKDIRGLLVDSVNQAMADSYKRPKNFDM